jgi:predicted dehydrogenase
MWSPRVEQTEALKLMVEKFVDCIGNGGRAVNDGRAGLNVVKLLEASTRSLKNKGEMVYL